MAFNARTKDLKSNVYSPTKPESEAAIRKQIDDSIQEVFDNVTTPLISIADGASGADNVGATPISGGTANTVQGVLEELKTFDTVNNVKLTGNQTVAGIKTFSSSPVVPSATTSTQATNKGQVDTLDVQNVKLTGNQTIAGVKTFSSSPIVPVATTSTQAPQKSQVDTVQTNLNTHKTSSDHDGRYYTETEVNALLTTRDNNLNTHKSSSDHDGRYYTETELNNGQLDNRYYTETEINANHYTKTAINSEALDATGAHLVGANVGGVVGSNVNDVMVVLRDRINDAQAGLIPDGSISDVKLSDEVGSIKPRVAALEVDMPLLFQSVSDGKASIASAITGKGVPTDSDAEFAVMATNIDSIETIIDPPLTAEVNHVLVSRTFSKDGQVVLTGTMPDNGAVTFTPTDSTQTSGSGYYSGVTVNPRPPLSGNALTSQVLAGIDFYSNTYTKQTGTIPSKTAQTFTPGTTNQTIGSGQYLSGVQTISGDADLVSGNIRSGANIFGVAGNSNVVDTSSGTLTSGSQLLSGYRGWADGVERVGTIPSKSSQTFTPGTTNQTIASGQYLSGTQTIAGDADLVAENIKSGVNIFNVVGNLVQGKKFASGTLDLFVNGAYTAINESGNSIGWANWAQVSGLTFTPSVIITINSNDPSSGFNLYTAQQRKYDDYGTKVYNVSNEGGTYFFRLGGNAYVNSTGFRIPSGQQYGPGCLWFAYE
jgi:hypothetical protein